MSLRGDSEIKFRTTPFHHRKVPLKYTRSIYVLKKFFWLKTMILAEIFFFFLKLYDILSAGKSRQGTITSLVPVSSNQNEFEMIEKDGFYRMVKYCKLEKFEF